MPEEIFVVPEDAHPERADKLIVRHFPEVSRAAVQKAIERGKARRSDGKALQSKQKLFPGDVLVMDLSPDPVPSLRPVELPLDVLHEDEHLIAINKSSGMVVHPGEGTGEDTLVHALLHHCGEHLSSVGAPLRPGIVHRLDKETSGVIVVAKTDLAHHSLASQFAERETGKEYLALVVGVPREKSGSITLPVGRHPTVRVKMTVTEKGKSAHTDWAVDEVFGTSSALLRCRIHTGRTHQIRVHLTCLGHPVVGDETYGYKPARHDGPPAARAFLHAEKLSFSHPVSGDCLLLEAPLAQDFSHYLGVLREQFSGNAIA